MSQEDHSTSGGDSRRDAVWVIAGSAPAIAALEPLIAARRQVQRVIELRDGVDALLENPAEVLPRGTEAVLVVGSRRGSPRRGLPGLFLSDARGRRVPVGWLPDVGAELAAYAHAAARVLGRRRRDENGPPIGSSTWGRDAVAVDSEPNAARTQRPNGNRALTAGGCLVIPTVGPPPSRQARGSELVEGLVGVPPRSRALPGGAATSADPTDNSQTAPGLCAGGPIVVLGQWEDRFLRVGLRTARWFERHDGKWPVFHWTADRISRENMLRGLADTGPALAFYFGHGRPRGWAGYHGVRREHFTGDWGEPMGALMALCCENASRWRTAMSFAETLALRGVFAGALAAGTKTRHEHNRRLGPMLCEALTTASVRTLGELVLALPAEEWSDTPYRFIGDPAAPLVAATDSLTCAARVFAPAPDEPLPPWEELSA